MLKESFPSDGQQISVERYEPPQPAVRPGVVLLHGADGLNMPTYAAVYRHIARELAAADYTVFLVRYFDRTGTHIGDPDTNAHNWATWVKTIGHALDHAAAQPTVDRARLGLVGVSLGAYLGVSVAAQDPRVKALVDWFGGISDRTAQRVQRLPPTLILHGDRDPIVPVAQAYKLQQILEARRVPHEMKIYARQGHGFVREHGVDARQRTIDFLNRHLKPIPLDV